MPGKKFSSISQYHASFTEDVQERLEIFRQTITKVIPEAEEVISYNMPAFKINAVVVYYAAFKNHISLFPAPKGSKWEKEFAPYATSGKGTIQFPFDKPVPVDLIKKIVKHLAAEDAKKAKRKK